MQIEIETIIKLVIAIAAGVLIGWEREQSKRPAGLRTHVLVSLGACLFTVAALEVVGTQADVLSRVIQGIATGVGFLGAGIIFHDKEKTIGLTTAAEIWSLAAIGTLAGLGSYALALIAAALILVVLVPFKWLERKAS